MKRIATKHAATTLDRAVLRWINSAAQDYDSGPQGVLRDLYEGGCQSGMVSDLIYYDDTIKFYRRHRDDIDTLLTKTMESTGCDGPTGLFGDKWDKTDPLARDTSNQNLLAWFGFEESARIIAGRAGIEI